MTLYNLLLQQIATMQMAQKKPRALRIDHDSADALSRELGNGILITKGQRIAGLDIEITNEPSFEVIDADTLEREVSLTNRRNRIKGVIAFQRQDRA